MAAIHLKHQKLFEFTPMSYTTIGDPYAKKGDVPSRYKDKQFQIIPPKDRSAGKGFFSTYSYRGDLYAGPKRYLTQQQPDKRPLGFGSHDASKRDEFTDTLSTEQYRELLRVYYVISTLVSQREQRLAPKVAWEEEEAALEAAEKEERNRRSASQCVYDTGRSLVTEECPKCKHDTFFCPHRHTNRDPGTYRTTSARYGEAITSDRLKKPEFAKPGALRRFYDGSHLHR